MKNKKKYEVCRNYMNFDKEAKQIINNEIQWRWGHDPDLLNSPYIRGNIFMQGVLFGYFDLKALPPEDNINEIIEKRKAEFEELKNGKV